jgi:hypothetical protein
VPTCADSANAKGAATDQNCASCNSSLRLVIMGGLGPTVDATKDNGGRRLACHRMPIQIKGTITANRLSTTSGTAVAKPWRWLRVNSRGATATHPTLAPVNARLSARPRRTSNQYAKVVEIAVELAPAHPKPTARLHG